MFASFCLARFRSTGAVASRPKGSRRRKRRFCERRALELMVNLQVCALNFTFLGAPFVSVSRLQGIPSLKQQAVINSLDMAHACLVVWNRKDVSKDKHPHEQFPNIPPEIALAISSTVYE